MLIALTALLVAAFLFALLGYTDFGAALLTGWGAVILALTIAGIGAALWRTARR